MQTEIVWWRRPQLLAALVMFVLGVGFISAGPLLRTQPALLPTPTPISAALATLDAAPIDAEPVPTATPATVVVYISGAVAYPDVYRLPRDARVKDAVVAAGGLRSEADTANVNLAAHLTDEQHIHVPTQGDVAATTSATAGGLIDINAADVAQFDTLPGIGPSLAERIISYRDEHGPFATIEALGDVSGIGPALLEKIRSLVTVGTT